MVKISQNRLSDFFPAILSDVDGMLLAINWQQLPAVNIQGHME